MSVSYKCAITGHSPPYLFDIPHADLTERAPTVHDLLEHAAQYHDTDCGCNLKVGMRVGRSPIPLSEVVDYDWEVLSSDPLAIDTSLASLRVATESSNVHLVIPGGHPPCQDYLRCYREKIFVPYLANDARVFKRTGAPPALPPRLPTTFDALCAIPGSTFVDKSEFLHSILCKLSSKRVGIIRRPKGFGKTTFLSMFDAFFDPLSVHAELPFTGDVSLSIFQARSQLLVFALDFADLPFERDMHREELEEECDRFMNAAARKFYARYQGLLRVQEAETSRPSFSPTFLHIIRWAKSQGWKICFTIDNYTAPVLERDVFKYKAAMSEDIFNRLRNLVVSSFALYGLILGDDVAHATQWPGLPTIFSDLTDDPAFAQVIGFTVDEVSALGHAVSADLISALPSGTPTGRYAKRVYAAADIIALARRVTGMDGPDAPAPVKVRTFKHPPPVKPKVQPSKAATAARPKRAVPVNTRSIVPVKFFDDFDDGDGPPDARDDVGSEGPGDCSLEVPELSDGSSGGSSSVSSDSSSVGRSSAPSSGGDKGRILLPVHDEPSSLLEGYVRTPWAADSP